MKPVKQIDFPPSRIFTFDVCEVGRKKHHMKALLQVDVTDARKAIKVFRRKTGLKISFTAWLLKTIADAIARFPEVHGFLKGTRKLMVFDQVDMSITVARLYQGKRVPLPYVIRKADQKSLQEIHNEIVQAQNQPLAQKDVVLGEQRSTWKLKLYHTLPGFARRYFWHYLIRHPLMAQKNMGTVMVTSVGMMGQVHGWFIHTSVHPISFGIGSIINKPAVVKGSIVAREFLHMTVLLDHDVIDGAPMARFISQLVEDMERVKCLEKE